MDKGIYKISNDRTGEIYVGQAKNLEKRKTRHFRELNQDKHHNYGMQKDYNTGDTFTFKILKKMPNASQSELYNEESKYIKKYNSFREGYNQTPGGAMDQFKGAYEYGGGRLPIEKYQPSRKYLSKVLAKCPNCNGHLIKRNGQYGEYAGCDNFPKCRFTCSLDEVGFYINNSLNNENPFDDELQKFCTRKNNYLTKADCDYLSAKYDIDISNVNTVKKTNPIIKNYLKEAGLWETAMEQLYNDKYSPIQPVLNQKSDVQSSKTEIDVNSEQINHEESIPRPISYYDYINNEADEQEELQKNDELTKSTTNFNFCSNCGFEIESDEKYCSNCGEIIDRTEMGQDSIQNKNNKVESPQKRDWGEIIATLVVIIMIILFIFSIIILTSDIEGPISTIAAIIFIAGVCFYCHISTK